MEHEANETNQSPAVDCDTHNWTTELVREMLKVVIDPELNLNIVDLGLIYEVEVNGSVVDVNMTLTSPGCSFGPYIVQQVKETLLGLQGIEDANIEVIWEPPWSPEKMSEEARLELGFDI